MTKFAKKLRAVNVILLFVFILTSVIVFKLSTSYINKTINSKTILNITSNIPFSSYQPKLQNETLRVKVSIPYWDQYDASKSFKSNVDKVNIISLYWYYVSSNGHVTKYQYANEDTSIIDFAKQHGVKVEVVITNLPEVGSWDSKRVEKILKNDNLQQEHIKEILLLVDRLGIDGVDIDYEQLDVNLKNYLSHFVQELSRSLHSQGKYLGLALHPKSDDGIGFENGSKTQDWKELSKGADNLYIMGFGEHGEDDGPGPVASLPWVERVVTYAQKLGIDRQKLFLTIPLYGYDWRKASNSAKDLTFKDVENLMSSHGVKDEWDQKAYSPHFNYDQGQHQVWYENARSVKGKINLAQKANFAGVTFWRLGGEDLEFWENLPSRAKL